jgi:hypothetical protein
MLDRQPEVIMKNAYLRMGSLEFTKWSERATTRIKVTMDRFIGEHPKNKDDIGKAHLISVYGNDQDIGAIWSATAMGEGFQVDGPGMASTSVKFDQESLSFRGSITIANRKRPLRHLVVISAELATTHAADNDDYGRTILCDLDSGFTLCRVATKFGLPVVPDWASWFLAELKKREKIRPLLGVNCTPCLVYGNKSTFLRWISTAVQKRVIVIPEENESIHWEVPTSFASINQLGSLS